MLTTLVESDLSSVPQLVVVERQKLDALLKEQKLSETDMIRPESGPAVGKLLGVKTLVYGNFGIVHSHVQASLRLVDTTTGQVRTLSAAGANENVAHAVAEQAVRVLTGAAQTFQRPDSVAIPLSIARSEGPAGDGILLFIFDPVIRGMTPEMQPDWRYQAVTAGQIRSIAVTIHPERAAVKTYQGSINAAKLFGPETLVSNIVSVLTPTADGGDPIKQIEQALNRGEPAMLAPVFAWVRQDGRVAIRVPAGRYFCRYALKLGRAFSLGGSEVDHLTPDGAFLLPTSPYSWGPTIVDVKPGSVNAVGVRIHLYSAAPEPIEAEWRFLEYLARARLLPCE